MLGRFLVNEGSGMIPKGRPANNDSLHETNNKRRFKLINYTGECIYTARSTISPPEKAGILLSV